MNVRTMIRKHKTGLGLMMVLAVVLAVIGIGAAVDNHAHSNKSADSATVKLNVGDTIERTVTEDGVMFVHHYSVESGGRLVQTDVPTPYIATNTVGDITEATIGNLCAAATIVLKNSRSDHPERDAKDVASGCNSAHSAVTQGKTSICKNSLLNMAKAANRGYDTIFQYSFTKGNLNAACGDEAGRRAAYASDTFDVPVLAVSTVK